MNAHDKRKMNEAPRPLPEVAMRCFGGPIRPCPVSPKTFPSMRELLGPTGPLAAAIPGYQERSSQIALAETIYKGLSTGRHVVAEAGTGTGKSVGALVPAIVRTMEQGGARANHRILISTAMLILQDQYVKKDLPMLTANLGIDFQWTVRKGRSNYACFLRRDKVEDGKIDVRPEDIQLLNQFDDWLMETDSGDVAELPWDMSKTPAFRRAVTSNSNQCRGRKCAHYDDCFYYVSKDRATNCDIIVVNHALLVLNEICGGQILPEYDALIIDEAHKLEDIVRSNLQKEVTPRAFGQLLDMAAELNLFFEDKIKEWRSEGEQLLDSIEYELHEVCTKYGQHRFDPIGRSEAFIEALKRLQEILSIVHVAARRAALMEEGMSADDSQARKLEAESESFVDGMTSFLDPHKNGVIWAERSKHKDRDRLSMHVAPIRVGPWMKWTLLKKPCVFMSATLATGRGEGCFDPFKERLGIENSIDLQVESPFDYIKNTIYSVGYYPGGLDKPPGQEDWSELIYPRIKAIVEMTGGGALLLFTSWKVCEEIYWRLAQDNDAGTFYDPTSTQFGESPWNLLRQGDLSKADTIENFKAQNNSILCATGSFFEGVDIPGSALRCVVIDKIPFPIFTDPIQSAISDSYGRGWFNKHHIPFAITHLKQGVGRGLRCETDRCAFFLLDPRFRSKGYGARILETLPGFSHMATFDQVREFMKGIA